MPKHNIPIHRPPPNSGTANPPGGGNANATVTQNGPHSGGPSADPNSASSIYAQQKRDQKKAERKAAQKYISEAERLQHQAHALRIALSKSGFKTALDQLLQNQDAWTRRTDRALMQGYEGRVGSLDVAQADNEKAAGAQSFANLQNRARERGNAVGEAMANGAGESDMLRAQSMSLNNWQANQNEVNRAFYDSRASINGQLTDLNVDTRIARINNVQAGNAAKSQLWTTYYNQRGETLTNLGNVLGQMADYYASANEMDSSKKTRQREKQLTRQYAHAMNQAGRVTGQAYHDPGIPKGIRKWEGQSDYDTRLNNQQFSSSTTELAEKKPEGASLRSWSS